MSSRATESERQRARTWYIDRARVKKLLGRDALLEASAMSDYALRVTIDHCIAQLLSELGDTSRLNAVIAVKKMDDCWREIQLRGEQLRLL